MFESRAEHPSHFSKSPEKELVDAMYQLGLKRAQEENSGKTQKAESTIASDESVKGKSSVLPISHTSKEESKRVSSEGKTSADALKGANMIDPTQIPPSSNGRVVSSPPKISRNPIKQSYGGDFSNGKDPVDLTQGGTPIENKDPQYSNVSKTLKGEGAFFEPKDTQGGEYKKDKPVTPPNTKDESPTRKSHHDPQTIVPGGVVVGEYGKDTEATQAELKDLYTNKPVDQTTKSSFGTLTKEEQKELETDLYNAGRQKGAQEGRKHGSDLEKELYDAGHAKGSSEGKKKLGHSDDSGNSSKVDSHSGSSNKPETADHTEEREQNKSVYNAGGIRGALKELSHGKIPGSFPESKDQSGDSYKTS